MSEQPSLQRALNLACTAFWANRTPGNNEFLAEVINILNALIERERAPSESPYTFWLGREA